MEKKRLLSRIFTGLLMALIVVNTFSVKASADMGAKPSIDVKVENGPDDYYIALLDNYFNADDEVVTELKDFDPSKETIDEYLENFSYEGWYYFTYFDNSNYYESKEKNKYSFDYMVPNPFRIIIVEKSGKVTVSEPFTQREYQATVTYDFKKNRITEHWIHKSAKRIGTIVLCFLFTLLTEGLILKLFKYPFTKRNLIAFLLINAVTNIPLNRFLVYSHGGWPVYFVAFFLEIIIAIVEGILYCVILHDEEDKLRPGKSFLYGIAANAFSVACVFVLYIAFIMLMVSFGPVIGPLIDKIFG